MEVSKKDIRIGDNVIFKRESKDVIAFLVSAFIKIFYPNWDRWGWHMAVIIERVALPHGEIDWKVLEATMPSARVNYLSNMNECRIYRWFNKPLDLDKIDAFVNKHLGCKYDIWKYLFTVTYGILRYTFKINLGKWENDEYYCWEMVEEFNEQMGKPFTTKHETLILPDLQKLLESSGCDNIP